MEYKDVIYVNVFEKDRRSYLILKYTSKDDEIIKYNTDLYRKILKQMKTIDNVVLKSKTSLLVEFEDGYVLENNDLNEELIRRIALRFDGLKSLQDDIKKEKNCKRSK